jgi:hypothetical protein
VPISVAGISTVAGKLQVAQNYWAWVTVSSDQSDGSGVQVHSSPCPLDFCKGGMLQSENSSDVTSAQLRQCSWPRLDSNSNFLCGWCVSDLQEWGSECRDCSSSSNSSFLFLALVLLWGIVLVLLAISGGSRSATGLLTIALYFGQSAVLEVGSLSTLISWMHVLNFDASSVGKCIAAWDVYEQVMAALAIPLVMLLMLAATAMLHKHLGRFLVCCNLASDVRDEEAAKPIRFLLSLSSQFSWHRYLAASLQILMFCFNRTALTCINYVSCITVDGADVVFAWPTMNCR